MAVFVGRSCKRTKRPPYRAQSGERAALFPMRCRGVMFMFTANGSESCHQSCLLGAIPVSRTVRPDARCRTRGTTSPCLISVDFGLLTDTFVSCNSTTGQSLMCFNVSVRTLIANVILDLVWTFFFVTTTFWTFVDFVLQGCRIRYAIGEGGGPDFRMAVRTCPEWFPLHPVHLKMVAESSSQT